MPATIEISARDKSILDRKDDEVVPLSWESLIEIINANELNRLSRKPSDLRYYLDCKERFKQEYGGTLQFLLKERLGWTDESLLSPVNSKLLENPADYKILLNDFPYNIDSEIVHLVVWSKNPIPSSDAAGTLTDASRTTIENFVRHSICEPLDLSRDNVLWFKNGRELQSVPSLAHFHVLLKSPSRTKLKNLLS